MGFKIKHTLIWLSLCVAAANVLPAQQNRESSNPAPLATHGEASEKDEPILARLLSSDDGMAILSAALESRHHVYSGSDCSHLVHAIYERAGFPYRYARSLDLYTGIDEFRRVTRAQPGDLVVWRGHVGIVINPLQHSFFSALRSGLGVESYDSSYWERHGRPRFFRYVKTAPTTALSASATAAGVKPSGCP